MKKIIIFLLCVFLIVSFILISKKKPSPKGKATGSIKTKPVYFSDPIEYALNPFDFIKANDNFYFLGKTNQDWYLIYVPVDKTNQFKYFHYETNKKNTLIIPGFIKHFKNTNKLLICWKETKFKSTEGLKDNYYYPKDIGVYADFYDIENKSTSGKITICEKFLVHYKEAKNKYDDYYKYPYEYYFNALSYVNVFDTKNDSIKKVIYISIDDPYVVDINEDGSFETKEIDLKMSKNFIKCDYDINENRFLLINQQNDNKIRFIAFSDEINNGDIKVDQEIDIPQLKEIIYAKSVFNTVTYGYYFVVATLQKVYLIELDYQGYMIDYYNMSLDKKYYGEIAANYNNGYFNIFYTVKLNNDKKRLMHKTITCNGEISKFTQKLKDITQVTDFVLPLKIYNNANNLYVAVPFVDSVEYPYPRLKMFYSNKIKMDLNKINLNNKNSVMNTNFKNSERKLIQEKLKRKNQRIRNYER